MNEYLGETMSNSNPFMRCLINTFDFNGRASRSEFVSLMAAFVVCTFILAPFIDKMIFGKAEYLSRLSSMFFTVPVFSSIIRRFHDKNLSGKWLLTFPTGIGLAIFMPVLLSKGLAEEETNQFGPPRY